MLLIQRGIAAAGRRLTGERGSAMASVIGLLAVTIVISTVIAAAAVSSLTTTSTARATVEAQAAADGGIAVGYAQLGPGVICLPTTTPSTGPKVTVTTSYRLTPSGEWLPGCPTASAVQVRVHAEGSAADDIVTREAEAIYDWNPPAATGFMGGPAVYAYDSAGFGGSGKLVSLTGGADVMIKTGDMYCNGAATGADDLVVDGGSLTIDGSCSVSGNVWASNALRVQGGTSVGGNAVAASIHVPGSSYINGSAWATGSTTLEGAGWIGGNITAGSLTMTGSAYAKSNAWVYGATKMAWSNNIRLNLTTKTFDGANPPGNVSGTRTVEPKGPGPSPYLTPARPVVPDWVDFTYRLSDWVDYHEAVMPAGTCSAAQINARIASFAGRKVVLDARPCTNGVEIANADKVNLPNDVVFVANRYRLEGSGGFTASGERKLWLITEDTNPDRVPTCPSGASFSIGGAFTSPNNIATMIYSPCRVTIASGLTITGQLFAGQAGINGAATLRYVPVGLPGVDLDTGQSVGEGGSATGSVGEMRSYRELVSG